MNSVEENRCKFLCCLCRMMQMRPILGHLNLWENRTFFYFHCSLQVVSTVDRLPPSNSTPALLMPSTFTVSVFFHIYQRLSFYFFSARSPSISGSSLTLDPVVQSMLVDAIKDFSTFTITTLIISIQSASNLFFPSFLNGPLL